MLHTDEYWKHIKWKSQSQKLTYLKFYLYEMVRKSKSLEIKVD